MQQQQPASTSSAAVPLAELPLLEVPLTPERQLSGGEASACGATCGRPASRELLRLWCDEDGVPGTSFGENESPSPMPRLHLLEMRLWPSHDVK